VTATVTDGSAHDGRERKAISAAVEAAADLRKSRLELDFMVKPPEQAREEHQDPGGSGRPAKIGLGWRFSASIFSFDLCIARDRPGVKHLL